MIFRSLGHSQPSRSAPSRESWAGSPHCCTCSNVFGPSSPRPRCISPGSERSWSRTRERARSSGRDRSLALWPGRLARHCEGYCPDCRPCRHHRRRRDRARHRRVDDRDLARVDPGPLGGLDPADGVLKHNTAFRWDRHRLGGPQDRLPERGPPIAGAAPGPGRPRDRGPVRARCPRAQAVRAGRVKTPTAVYPQPSALSPQPRSQPMSGHDSILNRTITERRQISHCPTRIPSFGWWRRPSSWSSRSERTNTDKW